MKKLLLLILCLTLAFALASCGGGCTEHVDADKDGKCDECGAEVEIVCTEHKDDDDDVLCDICGEVYVKPVVKVEVDVAFTIKDQEGAIVPSVTVTLVNKLGGTPVVVAADANGAFTAKLETGSYRVSYDYNADAIGYYLADTTEILVSESTAALTLNMINNNPNGTAERPYIVYEGENEFTIPAGSVFCYKVPHVIGQLLFDVKSEAIKVTFDGNEYLPEAGVASFSIIGSDSNSIHAFTVENTTDADASVIIDMYSLPGTFGNPIEIEDISVAVTTEPIVEDVIIYYTYTATASGTLTLTVNTEGATASMTNNRNSTGAESGILLTLEVEEGDQISINCTTVSANPVEVTFTLALAQNAAE